MAVEDDMRGGPEARRAVLIAGPTASGKSTLALALAERTGGRVVNADALQVYQGLRVLTARPSPAEETRADHRLYGHVPPARAYNVADWLADIAPVLAAPGVSIVVGGTGLYLTALTKGLSRMPEIPDDVRRTWRERAAAEGSASLHAELARRDPVMAGRLRPSDTQRVTRALEVIDATATSLSVWQARRTTPLVGAGADRVVLAPDRAWLHGRIARRLDVMVGEGAVEEAGTFASLGLAPDRPAGRALGLEALAAVASGGLGLDRAMELTVRDTRRFAKRQETWFRNQLPAWPRIRPDDAGAMAAWCDAQARVVI